MSLDQEFTSAQEQVKTLGSRPDNNTLLDLYALFKQATVGNVKGSRPGFFDFKGQAKYDAWAKRKGQEPDTCKQAYVDLVNKLKNS